MKTEQNQPVAENKEGKKERVYLFPFLKNPSSYSKFIGLGLGIIAGILLAKLLARKGGEPNVAQGIKTERLDLRPD